MSEGQLRALEGNHMDGELLLRQTAWLSCHLVTH